MAQKTFIVKMSVESDEPDKIIECYIRQRLVPNNNIIQIGSGVEIARCFPYDSAKNAAEIFNALRGVKESRKARREGFLEGYNEAMAISSYKEAYYKGRSDERRYRREIAGN